MNCFPQPPVLPARGKVAFSLVEVMVACGIFFLAIFTILALVASTLRNARGLRRHDVDAGMVAASLYKTNKLYEGTESGDFGDLYPDYSWETQTFEAATNGLWEVDITIHRRGNSQPVDNMAVWILFTRLLHRPWSLTLRRFTMMPERQGPFFVLHGLLTPIRSLRRSGRAAFTLVEIMISITILSLVLAAIYSSWTAILRASKTGLEAAASVQRSRMIVRILEDSLSSSQCFAAHQQFHPEYYSFLADNGNEAQLSFVAHLSKSFPRSGKFGDLDVRRLTFSVESGKDGNRELVLRQNPILMEVDEDEKVHPLLLAKNVKEFSMQFWDQRQNDWVDQWKLTNQLPKLIMFTVKLADNPRTKTAQEEISRIVNLPVTAVAPMWQSPRLPPGFPGQPGQPGVPGQPGQLGPGFQQLPPGQQQLPPGQQGGFPGNVTPQ